MVWAVSAPPPLVKIRVKIRIEDQSDGICWYSNSYGSWSNIPSYKNSITIYYAHHSCRLNWKSKFDCLTLEKMNLFQVPRKTDGQTRPIATSLPTDQWTDQPTTYRADRVACTRLKTTEKVSVWFSTYWPGLRFSCIINSSGCFTQCPALSIFEQPI